MPKIPIAGKSESKLKASANISIKRNMFVRHIESVAFFCRSAAKIEDDYLGKSFNDLPPEIEVAYNSYVSGAIFISVVFLENLINYYISNVLYTSGYALKEFSIDDIIDFKIVDAIDWKPQKCIYPIIDKHQMIIPSGKLLYKQNDIRPAILNKYQLFLGLTNKTLLNENDSLFKNVQYL